MSEVLKVSGKKIILEPSAKTEWKFSVRPGGWLLARSSDGTQRRIMIYENRGQLSASLGGKLWFGSLAPETRKGMAGGSESDLVAQFPGKVRKILVQEGTDVAEAEPLILIEAMKMEFSIKAPSAGKIKKVLVKEGQQLTPGDLFFEFVRTE